MASIRHSKGKPDLSEIDLAKYNYGILESASSVRLVKTGSADFRVDGYDTGLLFGPTGEVRWKKRRDGKFHAVFIDDGEGVLTELDTGVIALWGEPDGNQWLEGRIPGAITEYPKELEGKRVGVQVMHYKFHLTGEEPVYLFRCKDLIELKGVHNGNQTPV